MRTKTLVLAAAALSAGLLSASAQVYSLNIVGYVNVTVPPNSYKLIANPLNAPTNTVGALIPVAPDGCQIYKFVGGSWSQTFTYDELEPGWLPNGNASLAPGEGAMFRNNQSTNITLTFVGEVKTGNLTNSLPSGYNIVSSMAPIGGTLDDLGFPKVDGDQVYTHTGTWTGSYTYDELEPGWLPGGGPIISVGQAFMSRKLATATWVKTFNP